MLGRPRRRNGSIFMSFQSRRCVVVEARGEIGLLAAGVDGIHAFAASGGPNPSDPPERDDSLIAIEEDSAPAAMLSSFSTCVS